MDEFRTQLSELMHEIMKKSKDIVENGDYSNLLSLCEQDITILVLLTSQENLTAKEISNHLKAPKTTIVTAVSRLVKRGYLKRVQNENDRREMNLQLTEKGVRLNREHDEYETLFLDSLVNRWSKDDQKELARLLANRKGIK
ncbi:MAG TPA: MarR family transcriptional regulator [Lachnospiraceae bacterium]|nr:MarR family transcriptional regulator [Lachnospiraceae bacterium]